jgi:hypothetical protein
VVADDLFDDEGEELLRELRVEAGRVREHTQPLDLGLLARGVGRRHTAAGLELTHLLRALEALREQVHEGSVDVVDAGAQAQQLSWCVCRG